MIKFYGKQLVLLTFIVIKVHKNPINPLILLLSSGIHQKEILTFLFYHYKIKYFAIMETAHVLTSHGCAHRMGVVGHDCFVW